MKTARFVILLVGCALSIPSYADCVHGAKDKKKFTVIDSHTVSLGGGTGPDIIIRTHSAVDSSAAITVLKDSFCSHETAVLYVDGETVDATKVSVVEKETRGKAE
jgi:hypothetical protein